MADAHDSPQAALDAAWGRLKKASRVSDRVDTIIVSRDEDTYILVTNKDHDNLTRLLVTANENDVPPDDNQRPPDFASNTDTTLLILAEDLRDGERVDPPPVLIRAVVAVDDDEVIHQAWAMAVPDLARLLRSVYAENEDVNFRVAEPTDVWRAFGVGEDGVIGDDAIDAIVQVDDKRIPVSDVAEAHLLAHAQADMEMVHHGDRDFAILCKAPWVWCGTHEAMRSLGQPPGSAKACFSKGYRIALLKARGANRRSSRLRRRD